MNSWTCTLSLLLVVASLTSGKDEDTSDSLRSALEAINRRQRDLADTERSYYSGGGPGLGPYQYPEQAAPEELAFLAPSREFSGDGQPEDIGYGYQKSIPSSGGILLPPGGEGPSLLNAKVLGKLLREYLEDEALNPKEEEEQEQEAEAEEYYRQLGIDPKRSVFRERESHPRVHPGVVGRLETMRKRGRDMKSLLPSSFRERLHVPEEFEDERKRRFYNDAVVRKIEEEQEGENRRNQGVSDRDYLEVLQNVWDKYRKTNPEVVDIEDISGGDVAEILGYLGEEGALNKEDVEGIKSEAEKRYYGGNSYGGGYDFFNNQGAMGGYSNGGHTFGKRWNQHIDGDANQKGSFLYSLKFVQPGANREAVEMLKEEDGMELPDERDEDIVRLGAADVTRREPDPWFPAFEKEAPPQEMYGPNDEIYQRLVPGPPTRKRVATLVRPNYSWREMSRQPTSHDLYIPDREMENKLLYEASKRKRYPVTKRSPNYYASPPLLHHKSMLDEAKDKSNKKDGSTNTITATDPKVARELNKIFSADNNSGETKTDPTVDTKHVATTHVPVETKTLKSEHPQEMKTTKEENVSVTTERARHHEPEHHKTHETMSDEEIVEQPITMTRMETPLDIKKKSIDWSDYFGIDRRRKKTGPESSNDADNDGQGLDDDWLLHQYYKTLAMAISPNKKRYPYEQARTKKIMNPQPFDTRIFDSDIFSRNDQREPTKKSSNTNEEDRIDNMDSKLRNIEDLIVNEAVKYTGAHEGTTDSREIQEVKDKVMSRLAAAYGLEKMRRALSEFKSSLQAQRNSIHNPENRARTSSEGNSDEKKKRVAVKKEKAVDEDKDEKKKKKRGDENSPEGDENSGEFLEGPVPIEPLSEGYMGRREPSLSGDDCPLLTRILRKCRDINDMSGDHGQLFLPLCSLHQICYLCGPAVGSPSQTACDLMFLSEAEALCDGDSTCERVARRSVVALRRSQQVEEERRQEEECVNNACVAHYFLTSPLVGREAR